MVKGLWFCRWSFRDPQFRGWKLRRVGERACCHDGKPMNMIPVKLGVASAVILASLATPVVVQRDARVGLCEKHAALRQQTDRLAESTAENRRLSNLVAQAKPTFSDEQLRELMRLRGEVGMVR